MALRTIILSVLCVFIAACDQVSSPPQAPAQSFDVIISNGTIYDGSGEAAYVADVGLIDDRIAAIGALDEGSADLVIDATGKAVSPGFINMMAWGVETMVVDGRAYSDITQGITLEVMGEGNSMGPVNDQLRAEMDQRFGFAVPWTTLSDYLEFLESNGVSPNVASFIGATTPRKYVLGYDDVDPDSEQLKQMQDLVRQAMRDGALGVASSLIYTPAGFAETPELIALAQAASEFGGVYASHIRNEGKDIFAALQEFMTIVREANIHGEIYHLKLAHPDVYDRLDDVVAMVEEMRARGYPVTADVYPYPAGSTGLDAIMPAWVQEGGYAEWARRLQDPDVRARVKAEMNEDADDWESMFATAGPENILLVGFDNPALQKYAGMTLAEVAAERGTPPEDTAMDLVVEDGSRVQAVYFTQREEVVRQVVALPWTSFNTDAAAYAAEGEFLKNATHPRAYGTFPRVIRKYVREEGLLTLEDMVRKAAALPAEVLSIRDRGRLQEGYYADVLVFDPDTITDKATFEEPHQYSVGMAYVFVNGEMVLKDGKHTGATPGRVVRGPGWTGWEKAAR